MEHNITIGDNISFPMYVYKYNKDEFSFKFIEVGTSRLTVIGTFKKKNTSDTVQHMIVPVNRLRLFVEENGKSFYYDFARCKIKDPLYLNKFKAYMEEMNFGEVNLEAADRRSGNKLIVQDKIFIETASKLQENAYIFRRFQFLFLIIILLLIVLVSFMILRGYRQEMAIASSLGRPKILSAVSFFLENLFLYLLG